MDHIWNLDLYLMIFFSNRSFCSFFNSSRSPSVLSLKHFFLVLFFPLLETPLEPGEALISLDSLATQCFVSLQFFGVY